MLEIDKGGRCWGRCSAQFTARYTLRFDRPAANSDANRTRNNFCF